MESYDVLVVGMGPAGSSAALVCAEGGVSVLGIEKRQEIGSPKRCGEGLSKSALRRMGIKLPAQAVSRRIYGARVWTPSGKSVTVDFKGNEGWIVERKVFDKYLARLAIRAGAVVRARTELIDVKREAGKLIASLRTQDGLEQIETNLLIACDGIESKAARMLGLNTTISLVDVASCAQFEMSGIDTDPRRVQFWLGSKLAPGGYVWCFPKDRDSANVGIGVRRPWADRPAIDYLKAFISTQPGLAKGSIIEINCGGVPVGGLLKNMVADNLITAGDACHQVNPIHGGGIAEAWIGGRLAGQVAVKAIKSGNFKAKKLSEYNKLWWAERGAKLARLVRLRQVIENLTDDDLNWLADYIKPAELISLTQGGGFASLAKLLMRRPKLIGLARKLITK